jgi:hypothetical protein
VPVSGSGYTYRAHTNKRSRSPYEERDHTIASGRPFPCLNCSDEAVFPGRCRASRCRKKKQRQLVRLSDRQVIQVRARLTVCSWRRSSKPRAFRCREDYYVLDFPLPNLELIPTGYSADEQHHKIRLFGRDLDGWGSESSRPPFCHPKSGRSVWNSQ